MRKTNRRQKKQIAGDETGYSGPDDGSRSVTAQIQEVRDKNVEVVKEKFLTIHQIAQFQAKHFQKIFVGKRLADALP